MSGVAFRAGVNRLIREYFDVSAHPVPAGWIAETAQWMPIRDEWCVVLHRRSPKGSDFVYGYGIDPAAAHRRAVARAERFIQNEGGA